MSVAHVSTLGSITGSVILLQSGSMLPLKAMQMSMVRAAT